MRKFMLIYGVLVLLFRVEGSSQDSQFSQFFSSPLYLSPSLAGASEESRIILNYRNQWPNLGRAYIDYALSADHFLTDYNSGVGILAIRNQEGGIYQTSNLGVVYTYNIRVNRELKIRPGIKAAYYRREINYAQVEFADQITRNSASSIEIYKDNRVSHYDFSSSLLFYTAFYWLGFTSDHMLALNPQFASDPTYPALKTTVYGGAQLKIFESVLSKTDRTFTVAFLYKNQARFHQLDLGAYYEEHPFRVGIFFRGVPPVGDRGELNAIILLAGYSYRELKINYSYDIATSRLLAATGGAHEISLAWQFHLGWGGRSHKKGAVPCPVF